MAIAYKKVNWVLYADLKRFFDVIHHQWMMRFLSHRIADKRVLKLVNGWLNVGFMDKHSKHKTWVGTPQGAVISPLLANIYLHYVLDLWVQQWRKRHARGDVYMVRYADDFIMVFQYKSDSEQLNICYKSVCPTLNLALIKAKLS
jgi:RNA-directed DNA polymerase